MILARVLPFVLLAAVLTSGLTAADEPLVMPPMPGQADPKAAEAVAAPEVAWLAGDRILYCGDLMAYPGQAGIAVRFYEQLVAARKDLDLVVRQLANHGIGIERWRGALKAELAVRPAQVVIINIGLGEALAAEKAKATSVASRDAYRTALDEMIKTAQSAGAAVVLCTPPVLGDKPAGGPFLADLDAYAEIVRELAGSLGCELAELRKPQMELLLTKNPKSLRDLNVVSKAMGQLRTDAMDAATRLIAQATAAAVRRIPWSIAVEGMPFKGSVNAEIRAVRVGAEKLDIRYTTDGTLPDDKAKLYSRPFPVTNTTQMRVLATHKDSTETRSASTWWTEYRIRAADPPAGDTLPGLWVDHFSLKRWRDPIANLDAIKPEFTSVWPNFELEAFTRMPVHRWPNEWFGLRFTGWFLAPYDGIYRFATNSDDATRLWFGDTMVVKNDYLHPMRWAHGSIELNKGLHQVTMWYAQGPSQHGLEAYVALPGQRYQRIPDLLLRRTAAPPQRKALTFEFSGGADDAGEPEAAPFTPGPE